MDYSGRCVVLSGVFRQRLGIPVDEAGEGDLAAQMVHDSRVVGEEPYSGNAPVGRISVGSEHRQGRGILL